MKGKLHIIGVDGVIKHEDIDAEPTLDRLHELVGGWIERVPGFDDYAGARCLAFCNEEGKLTHMGPLPINQVATALWWAQLRPPPTDDYLAGPIVVVTGKSILRAMMEGP